ncbi:nitroreductase family protein [Parabacteroides sp. FAFU027]|uniref:nitroreductase family protein n=1 Tax=Parabacteroides sp. FAFU027 TaxID=2922715 RepID=UPI001FAF949F|nr:nitroreductase family protein [Parabacteroides sp. FAFU027]
MAKDFYAAVADRRTFYGIGKEIKVSDEKIEEVVAHAVKHTPSAFNSQSARVVLLLKSEHDKLWNITMEALRKIVPPEKFTPTEEKINSFKSGYGTVLYFENSSVVETFQKKFPLYAHNFAIWSQQSNGMLQFVIWSGLELEGLGASLQHYNELIEEEVKKEWSLPADWKLTAQMPFGAPTFQPGEKQFNPLSERLFVYK